MNGSLTLSSKTDSTDAAIAEIYAYLAQSIEPKIVNVSASIPTAEQQSIPWLKLDNSGHVEGMFVYVSGTWYSKMPYQVGLIAIFQSTTALEIGWEIISNPATVGPSLSSGYEYRKFTGSNLLVSGSYAYRRFDQALTS